ncbi:protein O-mannosyl-transferase TMTC1-like isoform X2 [Ptychodera flava]
MLSVFLGACNMFIKEHGITVLGVCIIYDVMVLSRKGIFRFLQTGSLDMSCSPMMKRIFTILTVLVLLMVFRIWMLNGQLPAFSDQDNPASFAPHLSTRFMTYCYLLVFNGWLLLAPTILCYDWQMGSIPLVESVADLRNLATISFIAVMAMISIYCLLCFYQDKKNQLRVILTALLFLVIPFLPASNLFIRVGFVVAERILYIPSLGICILVSHGINNICRSSTKRLVPMICTVMALVIVALFTWRTIIRNPVWNTRESLFKSGVHTLPHNAKAHYNYANYLKDIGRTEEAVKHYRRTLELYPRHASANNNLGTLLKDSDNDTEILFRRAIEINPMHVRAYFNLANYVNKFGGRQEEAISLLIRAIEIDNQYADAYSSLAGILLDSGRYEEAEKLYQNVIKLTPTDPNAYNNYGAYFVRIDQQEKATEQYLKCLDLDPKHNVAMVNIARLFRKMGKTKEAEDMYIRSLAVKREAETLKSLGALYFNTDRHNKAVETFQEALVLEPDSPEINTNYAQVLARLHRFDESITILHNVVERNPSYALAHRHLASVFALMKNYSEAIKHIDNYLEMDSGIDTKTKAEILYEQGSNYREINKHQDAIKCYKAAVEANPEFATAQMNLGAMYHMQDEIDLARQHYEAALKLEPNNAIILENMKKLENREAKLKSMKRKT